MSYLTLFEGKTLFYKLWLLLDLRAELDLRWTNFLFIQLLRNLLHLPRALEDILITNNNIE